MQSSPGCICFSREENPMITYQAVLYDIDGTLLNTVNMNIWEIRGIQQGGNF